MALDGDTSIAVGYAAYDVRNGSAITSSAITATASGTALAANTAGGPTDETFTISNTVLTAASSSGTAANVSVVRSLGGGASVFADFGTVSGTVGGTGVAGASGLVTSAVAIGTSVSF